MATESLRILEAAIEAWNRRDVEATLVNIREDVVWRTARSMPDIDRVYRGHGGLRRFFRDFSEPWEEISIQIEDVIADRDEQVVVLVRFHAVGREGIELDVRFIQIYRFDEAHQNRELVGFTEDQREQALREAGLGDD
jgi:ketosteroid isomerase-like protein